jgi:hypothetical protein
MNERELFDQLIEAGAELADAPLVRMTRRMLDRAEASNAPGVASILLRKARTLIARVAAALTRESAEFADAREALERLEPGASDRVRPSCSVRDSARAMRAEAIALDPGATDRAVERAASLASRLIEGGRIDAAAVAPTLARLGNPALGTLTRRREAMALIVELGDRTMTATSERARTVMAGTRLKRLRAKALPMGPYNPRGLAEKTLERLQAASPELLRAWWDLLEGVRVLEASAAPKPAPKRRQANRSR